MKIIVDVRETDLIASMKYLLEIIPAFKDLELIIKTLPLGDIIIEDETNEKVLIERKSIADLNSSIKDGRYEEQSYRLNGSPHANHNIIYLVEGDINKTNQNKFKDRIDKLTIYSAICSLNYFKGFSVIRTFNLEESALFICNTANKIRKTEADGKLCYYKNAVNHVVSSEDNLEPACEEQTDKDYVSVVKKVKKDNITPDNIGEIMLCQIPGISSTTAIAILAEFKSIPELIDALKNDENSLKNVAYTNAKGQTRKINKTSGQQIIQFLLKSNTKN